MNEKWMKKVQLQSLTHEAVSFEMHSRKDLYTSLKS
jgi:hypothetical protein